MNIDEETLKRIIGKIKEKQEKNIEPKVLLTKEKDIIKLEKILGLRVIQNKEEIIEIIK